VTTHTEARLFSKEALTVRFDREPFSGEVKALAGVACLETQYGDGWKGAGKGSFNMGAVQCGSSWTGARFSYVDTHPNADGTSTPYRVDFRKYPTVEAGWIDLASVVYVNRGRQCVREAAQFGDFRRVSQMLHVTGYYEGFGATESDRINNHYRALSRAIAAADNASAPVVPVNAIPETVRRGSRGEAVKLLQSELRLAADGMFGPITEAYLRRYQSDHGLLPDGVCGPRTWAALLSDEYQPEAA
jgi:hypothetical protein